MFDPENLDPPRVARCRKCHYVIEGLAPVGVCPECNRVYDRTDESSFTYKPPFLCWRYWAPRFLAALLVGIGLVALDFFYFGAWGVTAWLGVPIVAGVILGYGFRLSKWILPALCVLLTIGLAVGVVTLNVAGVFCGLMLSMIYLLPVLLGAFCGFMVRDVLKLTPFGQRWHLPVLAAGAGIIIVLLGRGPARRPVESVSTSLVIPASPAVAWDALLFYEEVEHAPPFLLRVGLARPLHTQGRCNAPGDTTVCIYNKGHITKRATEVVDHKRLAFDIVDQKIGYEHDVRLTGGSFEFEALEANATLVTLTTSYEPRLGPRWIWRSGERYAVQLLHGHVLEGMRRRALQSTTPVATSAMESHAHHD